MELADPSDRQIRNLYDDAVKKVASQSLKFSEAF